MIKYLILGSLMERPFHGYDLKSNFFKKIFKDFGINDGQLYPALKKLNQEGLIKRLSSIRKVPLVVIFIQ